MPAIQVTHLTKIFTTKRKAAGLRGSLRALVRPEYQTVETVRGISFQMEAGELLGFIGPNGAGKSTTIKILTGILFPTDGHAEVLGYIPWKQRRELAYRIGTVFGQRPQLWYHLPAIDTFTLFEGTAKFILFTILPAALMGAVPAEFVRQFDWSTLGELLFGGFVLLALAIFVFRLGLRRYESGSAIQVEV